jgi:hypothetical protein
MPTLITHAKPLGPQCLQAVASLQLPNLSALLRLLTPGPRQTGDEDTLSPLHEVLQARALGLSVQDGLLPWAALQAQALNLPAPAAGEAWAWLTPCHWQANADHVRMADPADSQIRADESRQVVQALTGFLAEDGIALHGLQGAHWLASGTAFKGLPTASLARASGGAVDHWLPRQPQAQVLRKLQNEMQMLLYSHPVNDARATRGLLPINSFWVSGTGTLPANFQAATQSTVLETLSQPAARDDAVAWTRAWQALDSDAIYVLLEQARRGTPVELTLCGETAAQSFTLQPQGLWTRLQQRLLPGNSRGDFAALLQSL